MGSHICEIVTLDGRSGEALVALKTERMHCSTPDGEIGVHLDGDLLFYDCTVREISRVLHISDAALPSNCTVVSSHF
jgi:hypothetical protein